LDDDGNPDNGIKITSATRSSITNTITLNSATAITALITGAGKTLKSEKEVVDHFKKTLKEVAKLPVGLVFVNDRINSAVENQTAAFTLRAEDNDNGSITYSISGGDSASFDLDGGTLTFKTSPDFETKDSYTFVAQATNTSTVITQTMVINITNENEKSVTIADQTFATVENMAFSQTIATGGDTARTLTILSGNTGSVFTLNSATGVITANENTLDFATNPTYNLVIQATGSDADNKTATITINVADTTISLSSSSYTNNGVIAISNSGYGSNNSPQYSWSSNATPTGGYAIIMDDEVSPCGVGTSACKHWAVLNITKTMTTLAEGATIGAPMVQGNNYDGSAKYEGPQPPEGATHTYKTTIYALKSGYTAPTDSAGATHSRASFEAAFASHIVAKATYVGEFKKPDAGLSYSSDTITEDGDGSVGDFTGSTPITITLTGDEFATNVTSTISVANVPGGLTLEFSRASSTTVEVTVSGAATNHTASDSVSNIEVKFTNTSFVNLSADSIPNSTKSDVKISFKDVANGTITYSGKTFTESSANDGSIDNKLTLTLSSDRNAYTYDDLSGLTIANVPTGLTAVKTKTSSTVVEISLTGSATAHANANDIANLSVSFADSVFTNDEGGSIGAIANTNTTNISVNFTDTAVTGVSVSNSETRVGVGSTMTLTADVTPAGATNQAITWSIQGGGSSIASIAGSIVTGVATGSVVVVATSDDNGSITGTKSFTIIPAAPATITAIATGIPNQVQISWAAVTGVDSYTLYGSTDETFANAINQDSDGFNVYTPTPVGSNTTSTSLTATLNGSTTYYVVIATSGASKSFSGPKFVGATGFAATFTSVVAGGKTWMDRNLGALSTPTSSADTGGFGDLYQWGRPKDGHQIRTSGTQSVVTSGSIVPSHSSFTAIAGVSVNHDWTDDDTDAPNQGTARSAFMTKTDGSGICPTGYRVPLIGEFTALGATSVANAYATTLKLPAAGSRSRLNGELLGTGGSYGVYWTASPSGEQSDSFLFGSGASNPSSRMEGYSIRCVKQ
jgi:Raf kinase inhibitor-like YbhB/YbcL family protein